MRVLFFLIAWTVSFSSATGMARGFTSREHIQRSTCDDSDSNKLLCASIESDSLAGLRYALEKNANPNLVFVTNNQITPAIVLATRLARWTLVSELVAAGADPLMPMSNGSLNVSAIEEAISIDRHVDLADNPEKLRAFESLVSRGLPKPGFLLMSLFRIDTPGTLRFFLNLGADPTETSIFGESPLSDAVYEMKVQKVQVFLDAGFSLSKAGKNGENSGHVLARGLLYQADPSRSKLRKMLGVLEQGGVSLDQRDSSGNTPLNSALEELYELLRTSLVGSHRASILVDEFLRLGVDPNIPDNKRLSPLRKVSRIMEQLILSRYQTRHKEIYARSIAIIAGLLIKAGANPEDLSGVAANVLVKKYLDHQRQQLDPDHELKSKDLFVLMARMRNVDDEVLDKIP